MSDEILGPPAPPPGPATFLVYRVATGVVIGRRFNDPALVRIGLLPGEEVFEVEPGSPAAIGQLETFFVESGDVLVRGEPEITVSAPSFAADGAAECEISGIPDGAIATIRGAVTAGPVEIDDGAIVLTSTSPGPITITLDCPPPWRRWEGRVDAV